MKKILAEIQNGAFAEAWIEENETGRAELRRTSRKKERDHPIEKVGAELRQMMPFLDPVTVDPNE